MTKSPRLIEPWITSRPPTSINSAIEIVGRKSMIGTYCERSRVAVTLSVKTSVARSRKRDTSLSSWPKALITRTPTTDSSACVVTWASACWASVTIGCERREYITASTPSGGTITNTNSATSGFIHNSTAITATTETVCCVKKRMP